MATYITSNGPRFIPDHLRLTNKEITSRDKKPRHGNGYFGMEMREIRALEKEGAILIDSNTISSVMVDKNKKAWKEKKNNGK